jgi:hemolysin activation/secretion protein
MLKLSLVTMALLAGAQGALAQPQVGAAGAQLQQIPPVPTQQKAIPDIRVERRDGAPAADLGGPQVTVTALHVTGQTRFSEADLIAASGFTPNRALTLSDLRDLAGRISAYYNRRGYVLAQAYLPAQDVTSGVVTIAVIEGRYGRVTLRNHTNLSNGLAQDVLSGLNKGDVVMTAPLERRLLLLSDVPGVRVASTLVPGDAVGDSDLIVDLTPGKRISGVLEADNAGSRYTGEIRGGATINLNDPTGHGDQATLRVLTSGEGLTYLRGSYQAQWRSATVGVAYSTLWYRLGKEFSRLDASGTAQVASLYGSYPLIRSRNNNLNLLADFDYRTFQDKVGAAFTTNDKRAQVLGVGFSGDHRDGFGGGGADSYSLIFSAGNLDIRSAEARVVDAATGRTNGRYNKLAYYVDRQQAVAGPFSLFGAVRGQIASKNLDISEKMELGGAYGVRAYPEGEGYGDQGYVATIEGRLALPSWRVLPGRTALFVFADTGQVDGVKSPWFTGPNRLTRSGAGVGVSWADNNNFLLKITYAAKLGGDKATSAPDAPGRLWVQLAKFF